MSLLELAETNPESFDSYNVQQILAICGDGNLLDGSDCSQELRHYLTLRGFAKLTEYANYCLENSYTKSGAVLQDVVNEMGRRLGYAVSNGRYSGSSKEIGFDGLWEGHDSALIVEVKTTDAYRINIDTVVNYAVRAKNEGIVEREPQVLLVVGRQDTGDLEAQVRGSRHAWRVRLVSVDALSKLMSVREDLSDQTFFGKVRRILFPFEYTRVDNIIDLVFETQREVEDKLVEADDGAEPDEVERSGTWVFTPSDELDAKRNALLKAFYQSHGGDFRRITRAQYINDGSGARVACSISKRYAREHQPYWYAFHPRWLDFLSEGSASYFILGCMDRNRGYAIPLVTLAENLDKLNRIEKNDSHYWHIALGEDDSGLFVNMSKTGERLYLEPFAFS